MTHSSPRTAILGHARSRDSSEGGIPMAMPAVSKRWTLDEVHSLPDDGNKYELIHGELYVTPPPSTEHDTVIARLTALLVPYVIRQGLGLVFFPRSVVRWRGSEVEPDLTVRVPLADPSDKDEDWDRMPLPKLVVEVSSKSTRRRDLGPKRDFYLEVGIPEYWFLDRPYRSLRVVRPGVENLVVTETYEWQPAGATEPLIVPIQPLFD